MKLTSGILWFVCSCFWLYSSCKPATRDAEFVLHLPNDSGFEISLETADTILNLTVDSAKVAVARLPLETGCHARLWVGDRRFPVWLEARTSVNVTLELNVLYFEGTSAKINEYLNHRFYNTIGFREYGMDDAAFRTRLENMMRERESVLDTSGLDPRFVRLERKKMAYDRLYELASNIVYGGSGGDKTLSGETFLELQAALTEDGTSWGILEYPESVQQAMNALARMDETSVSPNSLLANVLKMATGNLKDTRVIEFVVARSVLAYVRSQGLEETEEMDRVFRERVKRADYVAEYDQYCEKNRPLMKGQPAVPFTFRDVEDKEVSLSDLKGKYVYIDVWATWCGPCNAEIPHLKKLEEEFEGRNICFVSISCDDSRKAWERFVQAKQLGGIQLHMGGDKSFMEAICCKGIPRFMLIDQDGKFLNANMLRPSDGKTLEILNALPGL